MKIYAVKDFAVETFGNPFFLPTAAAAVRSFRDEVNHRGGQNSAIAAHPEDYILYEIGDYDADKGTITPYEEPQQVARAKDLIEAEN